MDAQPHPERVRLLPWTIPGSAYDAALIGLLITGFFLRPIIEDGDWEPIQWGALAAAIVIVLGRRRFPLPALAAAVIGSAVVLAASEQPSVLLPTALIVLYTVAERSDRKVALIAGAATTISFLLMITVFRTRETVDGAMLAAIAWPAFATAAGTTVRSTRENIAAANERARRAEESRELEAQRRVIEERLRIARDVHDLVAHHIAVVNVQAGVAEHLLQSDPERAGAALETVRGAASTVVDQLGELLGVLRSSGERADPTAPTPDLDAIDELVAAFTASGLDVVIERSGRPRPLSRSAEIAGYRVVQEALTNAHKHGDGRALVSLSFDPEGLTIQVSNPSRRRDPDDPVGGNGFGLVGMRERVAAAGGELSAGTADDGRHFEVVATLPGLEDT